MSRQLPVPAQDRSQDRALSVQQGSAASSIARLALSLAPDILRATERAVLKRDQPAVTQQMHGQSIRMSEVDIDTTIPFVRRITIRNASSWSTFPVSMPEPAVQQKRSSLKLIGLSGAAALVAAMMVRRAIPGGRIIDVQGRQRN